MSLQSLFCQYTLCSFAFNQGHELVSLNKKKHFSSFLLAINKGVIDFNNSIVNVIVFTSCSRKY